MVKRRYFFIRSKLNDLVLDVRESSTDPGAEIITFDHHGGDNQLFFIHKKTGTIRSKLNEFCMDFEGDVLVLNPYEKGKETQKWKVKDGKIKNRKTDKVFDIQGGSEEAGANILAFDYHGGDNQKWKFDFHYSTDSPGASSYEDSE